MDLSSIQKKSKKAAVYLASSGDSEPVLGAAVVSVQIRRQRVEELLESVEDCDVRAALLWYRHALDVMYHMEVAQVAVAAVEMLFGAIDDDKLDIQIQEDDSDFDETELN